MAISQGTRQALYDRAGGQCECRMQCSHHAGRRCPHKLSPGWEAHRRVAGSDYTIGNLIAMCVTCHKNTRTYGSG